MTAADPSRHPHGSPDRRNDVGTDPDSDVEPGRRRARARSAAERAERAEMFSFHPDILRGAAPLPRTVTRPDTNGTNGTDTTNVTGVGRPAGGGGRRRRGQR